MTGCSAALSVWGRVGALPAFYGALMKTLNWYIFKSLLVSMLLALGVLTFVMLSGHFFRLFELLTKGVHVGVLGRFLLYMLPDMLRFSIPLSMLVSTVLFFGRMSSDNEISALKASGISLWQIIAPGLLLSFVCCGICLGLSLYVSPVCRYKAEWMKWQALANAPLTLLEPGVFTEVSSGCHLRISGREGDELLGVHMLMESKDGTILDVVAERGRVDVDMDEYLVNMTLGEATVSEYRLGSDAESVPSLLSAHELKMPLDYGSGLTGERLLRREKYMDVNMLFGRMRLMSDNRKEMTSLLLDFHKRVSLSLSAFSFLLLGLPFGIRGKRSELSIGLLMCVLLALGFYVFLLLADSLERRPECHPEYIVWLPNILYLVGGLYSIHRLGKH